MEILSEITFDKRVIRKLLVVKNKPKCNHAHGAITSNNGYYMYR